MMKSTSSWGREETMVGIEWGGDSGGHNKGIAVMESLVVH